MYVRVGSEMVNCDEVKDVKQFYSMVEITYKNNDYKSIMCRSDKEASDAVNAIINAKNGVGRYYNSSPAPAVVTTGRNTSERIDCIDRQMEALAAKKKQLQEQKAAEDGAEALAALLVGGVCAIADAISSRRDKKRK